jgi:hypothetical protein
MEKTNKGVLSTSLSDRSDRSDNTKNLRQITMKTAMLGFIVLASTFFVPHRFAAQKPNIIAIPTDDQGWDDLRHS